MTKETEELDYVEAITGTMMQIEDDTSARRVALDLWKYYPNETQMLSTALTQSQHTKRLSKLEGG